VPFVAVLGAREVAAGTVALRSSGGQEVLAEAAAITALRDRCKPS